jgi:hypothetical protein
MRRQIHTFQSLVVAGIEAQRPKCRFPSGCDLYPSQAPTSPHPEENLQASCVGAAITIQSHSRKIRPLVSIQQRNPFDFDSAKVWRSVLAFPKSRSLNRNFVCLDNVQNTVVRCCHYTRSFR